MPRLALEQLRDLTDGSPEPARWRHWVLGIDPIGRITLPAEARPVGDRSAETIRVASRDRTLVLRPDGLSGPTHLNRRGRLAVPIWLRRLSQPAGNVLVAARCPDASLVVVTPASVLDALVDEAVGGGRLMDRLVRARVLVSEAQALGLTVEDLVAASAGTPAAGSPVPTVSEYLARIIPTFSKGTLRTYRSYWRLAEVHFGDRPIDTIGVDDCEAVVVAATHRAQRQRPGTDARSPRENCVAALRALFKRAKRARLILENPAAELDKPRRLPNRRRGLTDIELAEAIEAVRTTSRDPDLDLLLVRFHLESGARQEDALHLILDDRWRSHAGR